MAGRSAYLSADAVAREITQCLTTSEMPAMTYAPEGFLVKPWSTIYFLRGAGTAVDSRLVAKIARYPDQVSASVSWTSPELVARGRREYHCLEEVARHFELAPESLEAVRPVAYIDSRNAIVMARAEGRPIWSEVLHPMRLSQQRAVVEAQRYLGLAGEWLRWLHAIDHVESPEGRELPLAYSLTQLLKHVTMLERWDLLPRSWPGWTDVVRLLQVPRDGDRVWLHGDFHPGNLWVLSGGHVLAMDTALEWHGSPYEDIGKFVIGLRTRRLRVLLRGVFPSEEMLRRFEQAFLQGYFHDSPHDGFALLLCEGRYLFEKWTEGLTALRSRLPGGPARLLARLFVHPSYCRFAQEWMARVLQLQRVTSPETKER